MSIGMRAALTPEMLHDMAISAGACVRPVITRMTDAQTNKQTDVALSCGSTRESKCPPCAIKARRLRMQQCREGWHLDQEPERNREVDGIGEADGTDAEENDSNGDSPKQTRRTRSTRRRQDSPQLPRVPMDPSTVGRTFTTSSGRTFRPSMFVTITLPSYGPVDSEGTPSHPRTYNYRRAALDAIHFPKVIDRFWQNLRRCAGYRVQYFSTIEAQKRLAPHLHAGIRGAIPRHLLRDIAAATYHQVWWPRHDEVIYDQQHLPSWNEALESYIDLVGTILPTWDEALDEMGGTEGLHPAHVVRLGKQLEQ